MTLNLHPELDLPAFPDWQRRARCADLALAAAFHPRAGQSVAKAKAICADCEVRAECIAFALEHGIREGIWGGTSGAERRLLMGEES